MSPTLERRYPSMMVKYLGIMRSLTGRGLQTEGSCTQASDTTTAQRPLMKSCTSITPPSYGITTCCRLVSSISNIQLHRQLTLVYNVTREKIETGQGTTVYLAEGYEFKSQYIQVTWEYKYSPFLPGTKIGVICHESQHNNPSY